MEKVAIALGSNLGDRRAHLAFAFAELQRILTNIRTSSIIETDPVGVPDEQPKYLNAVVVGETDLEPEALLQHLMSIELARGRERPTSALRATVCKPNAARTLDLDIVLYGNRIIRTPALEVPHPRFRDRAFVLDPLAELEADWRDPVTGQRVGDLSVSRKP